jgi:hypothetical protein
MTIVLVETVFNCVDLTWREGVLGLYLKVHVVRPRFRGLADLGRVKGRDIFIGRRSIASTLNDVWWIWAKGAACADIVAPLTASL